MKRSYAPEKMDDFSIKDSRIDKALNELNIINKFLGGKSVSRKGIEYFRREKRKIKLLDVGSGGTNLFTEKHFQNDLIIYSDLNFRSCKFLKKNGCKNVVCANAKNLPFKNDSFSIIHSSLFLHHFTEKEIRDLLIGFIDLSEEGIIINDLRRSVFALIGIIILTKIFSKSLFVKFDAPLSVKRGFKKKDLEKILGYFQFKRIIIKRKRAFRWLIILEK